MTKNFKIFLDLEENTDKQSEHKYAGNNFLFGRECKIFRHQPNQNNAVNAIDEIKCEKNTAIVILNLGRQENGFTPRKYTHNFPNEY